MIKTSDLWMLDVVNVVDGKKLGNITDLDIDVETGDVKSLVISNGGNWFSSLLGRGPDLEIPWEKITKIGVDVILVELTDGTNTYRRANTY